MPILKLTPTTKLLDDEGRDWAWAFVAFRDVPGFPGYMVGSDGSVWCRRRRNQWATVLGRWRELKGETLDLGYLRVSLQSDSITRRVQVHNLVLEVFIGPRPEGMQGCHDPDRDPSNCRLGNLRWGTPGNNADDKRRHGTMCQGSRIGAAKLAESDIPEICRLAGLGVRLDEIGRRFGVHGSRISHIMAGRAWVHAGDGKPIVVPRTYYRGKLSDDDVREVRRRVALGVPQGEVARAFKVHNSQVSRIAAGKVRKNVE